MKIIVTGSLGNIGQPLTKESVRKGHPVTVISSKPERRKEIEALGAEAAVGTMEDADFLAETFKGADAVYLMETLGANSFSDQNLDFVQAIARIGENYKQAVERSGVRRVVLLSGIGAHLDERNGSLVMHHKVENILNRLPDDVAVKVMRPAGFSTNLFKQIPTVKTQGAIIANYGGDTKEPWVSPLNIAAAVAEEMEKPFDGRTVRYLASDEVSPNEIAEVLGAAIGNPDLKWLAIPDEQLLDGMLSAGMSRRIAEGFVEMQAAQGSGLLYEDYYRHKPILGKVKLADFAEDFALAYNKRTI